GGYETPGGGTVEIRFEGKITDAAPIKEFLEPQFRAADTKDLRTVFSIAFQDGLSLDGNAPEKLTEQMSRFAGGAAFVEAVAKARE
ncbi:MAG: hypothetical protein GY862_09925, partial [Gammaproteobacteria bacterium]|nr:hypothetical protein [Gammaproteobacteria bacterium]